MTKVNKVPPDGGYGWVVTLAFALNNVSIVLFVNTQTDQVVIQINTGLE